MKVYAVIDTNVIVSSMLTQNPTSPTKTVLSYIRDRIVIPMINEDILEEYTDVLSRDKFSFPQSSIDDILRLFGMRGVTCIPECLSIDFVDPNDVIFYETYRMRQDAYLVTGNMRHFPSEPRVVLPLDMVNIIRNTGRILSEGEAEYMWEAVERMRATALANGIADMSMEEIDEEIRQYRVERQARRLESK